MKDNTQRVPFDLELAKKITSGKAEGKIVTRDGCNVRILCTDLKNPDCPIIAAVEYHRDTDVFEASHYFYANGKFCEHGDNHLDLFIELPRRDSLTRMTLGNLNSHERVWIKYGDDYIYVVLSFIGSTLVTIFDLSSNNRYLSFSKETECWSQKPEFKPFDKILVRMNDDCLWVPRFFASMEGCYYRDTNGSLSPQCIAYIGNEHLAGTTDKPQY